MRVSTPGRINQACMEIYGVTAEIGVPRLMDELDKPHRVAARLDVNTNAVTQWLKARNWVFDPSTQKWIAPAPEPEPEGNRV